MSHISDYKDKSSCLFESLVYFVEKLSLGSLQEAAQLFPGKVDASFFTPKELDDYNRYRNFLVLDNVELLVLVNQLSVKHAAPEKSLTDNLDELVSPLPLSFSLSLSLSLSLTLAVSLSHFTSLQISMIQMLIVDISGIRNKLK